MINFNFKPSNYPNKNGNNCLLAKLTFPESQWGEVLFIYANETAEGIDLEAFDFYGNEIILTQELIQEPLRLEELIHLIETLSVKEKDGNYKFTLKYSGIPICESDLYPDLDLYFTEKRKSFGL
jgi:hypothetical protein